MYSQPSAHAMHAQILQALGLQPNPSSVLDIQYFMVSLLAISASCCRYYDVEIDDDQDYSRDNRNGKRWQDGNGRDMSRYTADQRAQGASRPKRWSPDSGGNVDWD